MPHDLLNNSEATHARNWTEAELAAAVEGYLSIALAEERGDPVNKRELNRMLRSGPLASRSHASVEWRLQNISAVLQALGRPWVTGYKPAEHIGPKQFARIREALVAAEARDLPPGLELDRAVLAARIGRRIHRGSAPPAGNPVPSIKEVVLTQICRDPAVVAWVLENAGGECEKCASTAPFRDVHDEPFLEIHHVMPLAVGGPDTIDNAVAVCPNCHRELHYGSDADAQRTLLIKSVVRLIDHLERSD